MPPAEGTPDPEISAAQGFQKAEAGRRCVSMPPGRGSPAHGDKRGRRRHRDEYDLSSGSLPPPAPGAEFAGAPGDSVSAGEESVSSIFSEIPAGEQSVEKPLICFLQTRPGQLYITRNFLAWRSKGGMGCPLVLVIHFQEVTAVSKCSTARIVDAIEVTTKSECTATCGDQKTDGPFVFTGVRERDRVFTIIDHLWRAHLRIPEQLRQGRPACASPQVAAEGTPSPAPSPRGRESPAAESAADDGAECHPGTEAEVFGSLEYVGGALAEHFSAPDAVRGAKELRKVTLPAGVTIPTLRRIVIASQELLQRYHKERGDEGFTVPAWGGCDKPWGGTRVCSAKVPTPMGQKQMYESQRFAWTEKRLTLHLSSQVPNVTYGTSFRCEMLCTFDSGENITMVISANVLFIGKPMFQGMISSKAMAGLTDTAKVFSDTLLKMIEGGAGKGPVQDAEALGERQATAPMAATPVPSEAPPAAELIPGLGPLATAGVCTAAGVMLGLFLAWMLGPRPPAAVDHSGARLLAALGSARESVSPTCSSELSMPLADVLRVAAALAPDGGGEKEPCQAGAALLHAALEGALAQADSLAGATYYGWAVSAVLAVALAVSVSRQL